MIEITETFEGIEVKFPFTSVYVNAMKSFRGAKYKPVEKIWIIPVDQEAALMRWVKMFKHTVHESKVIDYGGIAPLPELDPAIPIDEIIYNKEKKRAGEPCYMMPFQKQGVAYNLLKKRTIVGDEPGLGKTVQSIATTVLANCKCVLVVCPATLKENWKREWLQWSNKKPMILKDSVKKSWPQYIQVGMVNVVIVNYESLKKYFVRSIDTPEGQPLLLKHITFHPTIQLFDAVIIDELHRCKDGKTQAAKFCMGITRGKELVLGLTGTPVVNKPKDLIAQLTIIQQLYRFGNYSSFVERYCTGYGDASNLKELNWHLNNSCFYRREKREVLKDLPDKMRNIIKCEIENRSEYEKAENDLAAYLRENLGKTEGEIDKALRGQVMVMISILKKIAAKGKVNDMIEQIQEVVDAGEKIVVFAWHIEIVKAIHKAIPGSVTIIGENDMEERQRAVDSFQNDPKTKVIICNIKSGGVGLTLTASSRVAFIELPWNPATTDQCEDRCHRIGQKECVQSTFLIASNTIDEYIYEIIERKRKIVNQVTGASDDVETNVIDEFIHLFLKNKSNTYAKENSEKFAE